MKKNTNAIAALRKLVKPKKPVNTSATVSQHQQEIIPDKLQLLGEQFLSNFDDYDENEQAPIQQIAEKQSVEKIQQLPKEIFTISQEQAIPTPRAKVTVFSENMNSFTKEKSNDVQQHKSLDGGESYCFNINLTMCTEKLQ